MRRLRAVVADDEGLARARLQRLLAREPEVEVVADCASGGETVAALQRLRPDVVFLDIRMPELDGFGVLDTLPSPLRPRVVFVTAYSEHAVRAFDTRAVDYLLKPVSPDRLHEAVTRVRRELDASSPATNSTYPARLAVPVGQRMRLVPVAEIDYIIAHGNYVALHMGSKSLLLRETLVGIEAKLDPRRFLRIHRSRIVRLDSVVDIERLGSGQYLLRLQSGMELRSGRGSRDQVRAAFGIESA
jgi:two-component system, LytTR family, response regulator